MQSSQNTLALASDAFLTLLQIYLRNGSNFEGYIWAVHQDLKVEYPS